MLVLYLPFIYFHECVKTRSRSEATVCWEYPAADKETTKQGNQTLWCTRTSLKNKSRNEGDVLKVLK